MSDFAARVRHEMERRGTNSLALSKQVGVSQSTIWRIVNGDSVPSLSIAVKIARVLDFSLDNPIARPHCDADEAWSKFYYATDPAFRQYMFRDQFIAGFEAGRSS